MKTAFLGLAALAGLAGVFLFTGIWGVVVLIVVGVVIDQARKL